MDPTKISQQQLDKIAEKIFEANYFHGSVERAISRNINKQNMKTIELGNETGWVKIPGDTEKIVVTFKDGHQETVTLYEFLSKRSKNIQKIECYTAEEAKKL